MKTIILAGGAGSRLAEETIVRPKPMVEIGGIPILQHILSLYADHGHKDFIIACGYKGEFIKEYFCNFRFRNSDVYFDLATGKSLLTNSKIPDWRLNLVDTGLTTQTGGRIKRCSPWIQKETFMMTYGDGVGNVDIAALLKFHRTHGRLATMTAVRPPARFGSLTFDGDRVTCFSEKPQVGEGWINGGYMVLEPQVLNYIDDDATIFEHAPLEQLAAEGQLAAYKHEGFWQPMDTLRDKQLLENLWQSGKAPWKVKS
ncbi:MAG: glucose-1-phosphate cytidylyltransferase [Phycisphaerales bacterium]|nr:glucose-1-phosphate cytidylyltransferase [Phycisphaerales bacterium]